MRNSILFTLLLAGITTLAGCMGSLYSVPDSSREQIYIETKSGDHYTGFVRDADIENLYVLIVPDSIIYPSATDAYTVLRDHSLKSILRADIKLISDFDKHDVTRFYTIDDDKHLLTKGVVRIAEVQTNYYNVWLVVNIALLGLLTYEVATK